MGKALSQDQIQDILQMKKDAIPVKKIMSKHKITRSTVYYFLNKVAPEQRENSLSMINRKLDDVLQKLQDIEQYLSMQTMKPEPAEKVQDNVQHAKPISPEPDEVKPSPDEIYLKTSEIIMLVFTAKNKNPSFDTIQRAMKAWRYNNPDFNKKKGYPLDALLINLKAWNKKSSENNQLDFSQLEKLMKDSRV